MNQITLLVSDEDSGKRLDLFVSEKLGRTRSSVTKLIKEGFITVNDSQVKAGFRLRSSQKVNVSIPEEPTEELLPEPIPVEIVYRDNDIVVVNKPPGLVMYPAAGHRRGTLMNALLFYIGKLASIGGPLRPGVVHRLDKDTSGLIVVALSDNAYYGLVSQFKERTIKRLYYALVFGELKEDEGVIERPIGRSETHRKKMSTRTRRGRYAKTFWRVLKRLKGATLVEARLATGRTHQIRVHFASIGHPVLGDQVYGRKRVVEAGSTRVRVPRQMLHAATLGFVHPVKGEWLEFKSELPEDMKGIVKILE